jgi:hypothetical protein
MISSGSLIAANVVLTSAQKIKPLLQSTQSLNIKIIVGAHDITKTESVKRVYQVSLSPTPEGFLSIYRPICLVKTDATYAVGDSVIGAGWGRTSNRTPGSPVLQKVTLQFSDRRQCTTAYKNAVTNTMVCVSGHNKDMCLGDGGGPLMRYLDRRMYLVGVMSWGSSEGCAVGKPSVFADVRHALDWIETVTDIKTA